MRVAYVCLDPGVPVFGRKGSSVHCQEVMRDLQIRGFEVELFAQRLGEDVPHDLQDIKTNRLGGKLGREPRAREVALTNLNPVVYQMLEQAESFDLIYERYSLWSFSAMQFARERGVPGLLEVNAPLIHEQQTYRTLIDVAQAKFISAQCFKNASSLVAVSEEVADIVRGNYYAQHKTTAIPNGVNCDKFIQSSPKTMDHANSDRIVIGFVGSLKPWHGVATLIDAFADVFAKNPNVVLKIVGEGPELERLQSRMLRYGQEIQRSVEWLGAIPNWTVPQVLQTFDIAVAPYPDLQDFYFSPLKILEYMAAGLPVVSSRIGQIQSLIQHEDTGILLKSGCERELAATLLSLSHDKTTRQRLGDKAREHVVQHHTWHSVVGRILATVPSNQPSCETC